MTWYSSTIPFPPRMSRAERAMPSAFPHEFRLIMLTISGVALSSHSFDLPRSPNERVNELPGVLEAPHAEAGAEAQADLRHHVRQLQLHQLEACSQLLPSPFPFLCGRVVPARGLPNWLRSRA